MSKLWRQTLKYMALLAVAGCHTPSGGAPSPIALDHSTEPIRNHFNDNKDRLRIIALLSPT